jgi:hypothetical protein
MLEILHLTVSLDTVAYLQAVATRVFEKDGVIDVILPSGIFDVSRARAGGTTASRSTPAGPSAQKAIRFSFATWPGNSVTPKNFAGPLSGAAAAKLSQSEISVFRVKPSDGSSAS